MRAEDRLIIACACGAAEDPERPSLRAALLEERLDWERVLRLATENKVLLPVARELLGEPAVPPDVRRRLAFAALHIEGACKRLIQDFERVLPRVVQRNRVILLRGIAYSYTIYRGRVRRPIGDVDLLIDTPAVASISGRFGDHHHVPADVVANANGHTLEYHHDCNRYDFGGARVARIAMSELWARRRRLTVRGVEVAVLCAEDAIVYLSLHNVLKGFSNLYRFMDMLELLRAEQVDWDAVARNATRYGVSRALWMNARVLNALHAGAVPGDVVQALRPSPWVERLLLRLFDFDLILHDPNPRLGRDGSGIVRNWRKQAFRLLVLLNRRNWYALPAGRLVHGLMPIYHGLFRVPYLGGVMRRVRGSVQGE
jgi:hypothetical protein